VPGLGREGEAPRLGEGGRGAGVWGGRGIGCWEREGEASAIGRERERESGE
jgi:hypothetical protein